MGGSRGFVVPDAAYCSGLVCSERITNGVVTKKFERLLNRVVLPPSERDLLFKQFVKNLKTFGTSATGWNLSPYQFQMDHQDPEFSRSLVEEYHVLFGGTKRISLGQYLWRKDIHGEYRQNDPVIVSDEGIVIPLERMKVPGNDPRKKKGARQEDWKVEPVTEETRKVNHVPHMCPREVILLDVEEVEKHKNHPQHYTVHMAEKEIHVLLPFCQVECTHGNAVADTSSWPWVRDIFPEKEILEEREPKNKYFSMTRKIKCNYIPNEGFVYEPPTHPRCEGRDDHNLTHWLYIVTVIKRQTTCAGVRATLFRFQYLGNMTNQGSWCRLQPILQFNLTVALGLQGIMMPIVPLFLKGSVQVHPRARERNGPPSSFR